MIKISPEKVRTLLRGVRLDKYDEPWTFFDSLMTLVFVAFVVTIIAVIGFLIWSAIAAAPVFATLLIVGFAVGVGVIHTIGRRMFP